MHNPEIRHTMGNRHATKTNITTLKLSWGAKLTAIIKNGWTQKKSRARYLLHHRCGLLSIWVFILMNYYISSGPSQYQRILLIPANARGIDISEEKSTSHFLGKRKTSSLMSQFYTWKRFLQVGCFSCRCKVFVHYLYSDTSNQIIFAIRLARIICIAFSLGHFDLLWEYHIYQKTVSHLWVDHLHISYFDSKVICFSGIMSL